ncbi:preprotein translocase subunit SecA [Paenibacillus cymbidii]|uniref:preprotein translocase subunit SecA n=1 Tax=Paenibacillus cymbidii TaxID=1639034 RepID=UPI00108094F6|nr:preprotein translocase subunit SecA [Paenibacillus cymbidii]
MSNWFRSVFGNDNERELRRYGRLVKRIHTHWQTASERDDESLRDMTAQFRERLRAGEPLDNLLPEAFACAGEAAWRALNMRHYDVQLMGGIALHEGKITEMKTGEGKTFAAVLPVYLNAIAGDSVHVITANEYLAKRDSETMKPVFDRLGLTVGCNLNGMSLAHKRDVYARDVIYGTGSEFGFDYLRDHMALFPDRRVQRAPNYALIDEVDSILIDEARTPLIISGRGIRSTDLYYKADRLASVLKEGEDFTVDARTRAILLAEGSVHKIERLFGIDNLFAEEHLTINHHMNQAIRARYVMKRDVDYIVQEQEIVIVDEYTGRLMIGRRYSDGLHQAIEAKEGCLVKDESVTKATITYQNYFRVYRKLAGMTGTAITEEDEFRHIYGLRVMQIPTNRPTIRRDEDDVVFKTAAGKFRAIVDEIVRCHATGQPVLVGTISIEHSDRLSALLKEAGVEHRVLHAKHHEEEAAIIGKAGQRNAVTIATNMAGRGTDIVLGEGVAELGGLYVIGTERHESRRIDNQLRGRSGRQGDPGVSRFYLSMEDELMRRFGSDKIAARLEKLGFDEETALEGELMSRGIESAQRIVEASNFDTLMSVMRYDDVIHLQRERIYRDRREVLDASDTRGIVLGMIRSVARRAVVKFCPEDEVPEDWSLTELAAHIRTHALNGELAAEELWGMERETLVDHLAETVTRQYAERERQIGEPAQRSLERFLLLQTVDSHWIDHLDAMDQLRQGIHLRLYAGTDPLREYETEGHAMFLDMVARIEDETVYRIMKVKIDPRVTAEAAI